jgi:hypothetical protein
MDNLEKQFKDKFKMFFWCGNILDKENSWMPSDEISDLIIKWTKEKIKEYINKITLIDEYNKLINNNLYPGYGAALNDLSEKKKEILKELDV